VVTFVLLVQGSEKETILGHQLRIGKNKEDPELLQKTLRKQKDTFDLRRVL
jgi:hypothetical protein